MTGTAQHGATTALDDHPGSLGQVFLDRVAATPDREAFRHPVGTGWQSLTWADTRDRAFAIAAGLIGLGVGPGERVAIAAETRMDWILADFGILCAGAATTTVYPNTGPEDFGYILTDSQSRVIFAENAAQVEKIADAELPDLCAVVVFDAEGARPVAGKEFFTLDELAAKGRALLGEQAGLVDDRIAAIEPETLATLIYTSGTTGRPKGVQLVHANWTYEGKAVAALDLLHPDDVQYLWLPLSHVFGKMLIAMQMELGFATAVDGDLNKIVENLGAVQPTFMAGAPRVFEKVKSRVTLTAQGGGGIKAKIFNWAFSVGERASDVRQARKPLPALLKAQLALADRLVFHKIRHVVGGRIRFFVSGSAKLSADVARWFDAAGLTILEGYGLTETSAACSVNMPHDTRIGTVGPALPGSEFKIAEDGEILLRGGGVMRGYHHNPEATAEVMTEDWFHTGDIGEMVDGFLKVTDRKKDLIKTSGGKYVAPQKVETIFKAVCPYASHIVVHGDGRKFVSALITLDPDTIFEWAEKNGHAGASSADLAKAPDVIALINGYVDQLNSRLERWETIKKFVLLPDDLSVDAGELTPSMKVRRKIVERAHMAELDALYID